MHGMEPEFATYNRGTKVIDYILMDPDLVDSVAYCGYEPFGNRFKTDHRGFYIDVITDEFFGNTTLAIHRLEQRGLVSTKAHQIAPYFQVCTDHAAEHTQTRNYYYYYLYSLTINLTKQQQQQQQY